MIGEIRDLATGGIAIKAALTATSCFPTHPTTLPVPSPDDRYGIEEFNVASAVNS